MAHKVFICHSSQNKPVAEAACAALESARIPCWIAPRDILAGEEYGKAIMDALSGCEIVLLIFSHDANNSPQVRREIERAVSKGKIIVPFRIEQVQPSDAMEYALGNTHWLDAITPPMERSLADLCSTISKLIELRHDSDPLWRLKEEVPAAPAGEAVMPPVEPIMQSPDPVTPPGASAEPAPVKPIEQPFRAPRREPEPAAAARRGWGRIAGAFAALLLLAGGVFAYVRHSGSSVSESAQVNEAQQPSAPTPQQPAPQDNPPALQPASTPDPPPSGKPVATPAPIPAHVLSAAPPVAAESASASTPALNPAETAQQARQLYADKRFAKAFPLARESCAQNNPQSCYLLGNMYVGGYGVAKDATAGAEFIQKACQAAVVGACGTLGVLYASGDGVPQDHPKAISLLTSSCDNGNAADCFTLGKIFSEALYGFNRQPPRAQMYFHKACDGKLEQACNRIRPDVSPHVPSDPQPERRRRNPAD